MATIKFWSEMTKATTVDGEDKVMIGRNATGEAMYMDYEDLVSRAGQDASTGIEGVSPGALPTLGSEKKSALAQPGTYTQSGSSDIVVPEGSMGILFWDGSEWSLSGTVEVPEAKNRINVWDSNGSYDVGDQVIHKNNFWTAKTQTSNEPEEGSDWSISIEGFKEVSPDDTSFIHTGKNLFNKDSEGILFGKALNHLGQIDDNPMFVVSDYVRVKGGTQYTTSGGSLQTVVFYDGDKDYISGIRGSERTPTFETPTGAEYLRINLGEVNLGVLQIEEGEDATEYESYNLYLSEDINLPVVNPEDTSFFTIGKNLFNKDSEGILFGKALNALGEISDNSILAVSDYIRIDENTEYTTSGGSLQTVVFYDGNKNYISGIRGSEREPTFETPSGSEYLRTNVGQSILDVIQIEKGTEATEYEEYGSKIKKEHLPPLPTEPIDDLLPEFAREVIDDVKTEVIEKNQNKRFLNFAFITDTHINQAGNNTISERTLVELANEGIIDCVVGGGDYVDAYGATKAEYVSYTSMLTELFGKIQIPTYYVVGNHDRNAKNNPEDVISLPEFWSLYNVKNLNNGRVKSPNTNVFSNYFYVEFDEYKIRLIILNGHEHPSKENNDFSQEQLSWLENTAFDMQNGWGCLVFSHVFRDISQHSEYRQILSDFVNGGGNLIGVISGHEHNDGFDDSLGFNVIHTGGSVLDSPQQGKNQIRFDVFTVDTENNKLYATRAGRGSDREFNF